MVKKPEKVGGQQLATGGLCLGPGGETSTRRRQWGAGAEPPATEKVCFIYTRKSNF